MKLLMISGDRSILQSKQGAFWYTLQEMCKHWERIDVICPRVRPFDKAQDRDSVLRQSSGQGFGIRDSEFGIRNSEFDNVFFHPSPWPLLLQPLWILRRGKVLVAEHRHDVMTVHEYPPFYNGIGARLLAKRTRLPYALEVHHIVGHPKAASLIEYVGRLLSRFYLPIDAHGASSVRTVNPAAKKSLAKWGIPEEKIQVVSSFYLDRDLLTSISDVPIKYDIVFCARLVKNKGLDEVIDAVVLLKDVRMVVIGDGPERKRMEQRAQERGVRDRIDFLGWLPDQRAVMETIKSAKIFVMNSKSEGGPRILLEAMGCGMPVIATPVGVAPDVIDVGKNGMITTGSAQNLGCRIQSLLHDEDQRKKIGEEARKVLDRFERSVLVKAYAEFLKSLA